MRAIQSTGQLARARLALIILSPVLIMSMVIVAVSLFMLYDIGPVDAAGPDAGIARIGDSLAFVLVTDGGPDAAATRQLIADWGLLAPAVVLVVSSLLAWWLSGRVQRTVARAEARVSTADRERELHLQEIVHELRTPLAVMGTNLELAGSGSGPSKYLDAASRAVMRMSRTVDDLAGHGQLSVENGHDPIDLKDVVETIAHDHVGPGSQRGVFIRLGDGGTVKLEGVDPAAVRTVMGNFATNAMRYAPKGSVVGLDWGVHDDWAWLSVTDQGPGIAPQNHSRVFERGWQGSHDRDRQTGSGLGMTIARQLTEAQGGQVSLESEEGGGATFTMWLPLSEGADPGDVMAADRVHALVRPWETPVGV